MEDVNLYRSKLRSPNRCRPEVASGGQWDHPDHPASSSSSYNSRSPFSANKHFHTPNKNMNTGTGISDMMLSPHKSGYFLRTPSPLKKLRVTLMSPSKSIKLENPGTPSPNKASSAGSATDLFGNKSLLDNLDVPEDWDEKFLNNFQDDWLFGFGFGNEDLEHLTKTPLKSLQNTPKKFKSALSPFKSPLLTSSPKLFSSSPGDRTPGGRPLTRQRKLFLQSPEHQVPQQSFAPLPTQPATTIPFPPVMDTSSSSMFSEGGLESSSTIHSISSYLKNFDEEDHQDDLPVMPPAGWTSKGKDHIRVGKSTSSKNTSKSKREKSFTMLQSNFSGNVKSHPSGSSTTSSNQNHPSHVIGSNKKIKSEPQFTLLRPFTEFHTNQISLRTTPVTPPHNKISRDFSQIQTLPSKEQLRIVRNRFRDTLNKAVEQVIEEEKTTRRVSRTQQQTSATCLNSQQPTATTLVNQPPATAMLNNTQHAVTTLNCVNTRQGGHIQHPSMPQQMTQTQHASIQISGLLPQQYVIPQFNIAAVKPLPGRKRKH